MREFIDAAVFKDIILCANAALEQNRQLINELNVFPVPDGDTGTNMSLTMGAAAAELSKKSFPTLSAAADCAASAMLRGARGNSGVILSLLFRGLAKRLKGAEKADAKLYAAAMSDGVDAAYKAVMKPAEGTILRRRLQGRHEARRGHHPHRLPRGHELRRRVRRARLRP